MPISTERRLIPSNVSDAWARLSRRERLLLAAGALAASVFVPLKAHDWADEKALSYQAAADAARTAAASAATNYPALDVVASRELARARGWALQTRSVPVARVLLEEECQSAALKAGINDAEVRSAEAIDTAGPFSFVSIEITGSFTWPTFQALIANLVRQGHLYVVNEIEVPDGPKPRFRLQVRAPVYVDESSK